MSKNQVVVTLYRILYVDDEPSLLDIGKLFLERSGQLIVDTTTSAPAALSLINTKHYDAIISDYQMPGMDGIEFLKEVRTSGNKIPFILFTGRGREEVVIQALNAGVDFYLQKGGEPRSQFAELSNKIHYAVMNRNAEEALRNSERMLAEAMNLANLTSWECDLDTGILMFDDRFSTLYGTTAERKGITQMTAELYIRDVVHPEDRHVLFDEYERIRKTTDPHYVSKREYRIITGDGETRYIEMCVGVTKDAKGRKNKTHGVNRDITERKNRETELRGAYEQITAQEEELRQQYDGMVTLQQRTAESQQMLGQVLNTVPVRVLWKGTDLRYLGSNEPFVRDAGLSVPDDLIGKTDFDMAWREQAELYRADDRSVIDTGLPKIGYEERLTVAGGNRIWRRVSKVPLRGPGGTIIGILGIYDNITESKRAEKALRESEKKFRMVVENSHDGIMIVDVTGTILFSNRAAAKVVDVMDKPDLSGTKNIMEFIVPESRSQVLEDFSLVAQGIDTLPMNYQAITATGRKIWIKCVGKKIRFQNSSAIIISMREVTSRKRMENTIEQAKKLNLLSCITRHDINNQLQVLIGYVELLHQKVPDPSFENYFSPIMEAVSQINGMIQFNKEYENIGVQALIWQDIRILVDNLHKDSLLGQVTLKNDLPRSIEVFADPLIVTVFFNLIDNALRHGGRITTIRFSFEARDEDRIIVCEDDGEGVVTKEKERIFDRGFGKHTGLGLAISREILGITGITIKETGEPGKGARFEIMVPKGAYRIADHMKE